MKPPFIGVALAALAMGLVLLAGCTQADLCQADAVGQPLAVMAANTSGSAEAAAAVAFDTALVHPLVVQACAKAP